jgi:hypothetical protein
VWLVILILCVGDIFLTDITDMSTSTCAVIWTCVSNFKYVFGSQVFITFGGETFEKEAEFRFRGRGIKCCDVCVR